MSLEALRIRNLRCLTDTGWIPIKPITVLVGRNSSGKSTFLRAFPLLKQSVETARNSPILWQQPGSVDFGNIDLAINDQAVERSVSFEFLSDLPEWEEDDSGSCPCAVRMDLASSSSGPHVSAYDIRLGKRSTRLELDSEHRVRRLEIDSTDVLRGRELWLGEVAYLIAGISGRARGRLVYQPFVSNALKRIPGADAPGEAWGGDPDLDEDGGEIDMVLKAMDAGVARFMSGVTYIGPQHPVGERLYRQRDVAVEEINADGQNLSDFLASLSSDEMRSLAGFTRTHLGFEPSVRTDKLNIEILVKEADKSTLRNIADVGFGYAEVLPVCASLWSSCVREPSQKRRSASLVALEQPEMHLHPEHQAKLAGVIVGAWRASRDAQRSVRIMIETHSEGIVNRLGDLIRDRIVSASEVQIVFFDQDPETRQTEVRLTGYTEDGGLKETWPFGFFAPVMD